MAREERAARNGPADNTPAPEVIARLAEDVLPMLIARLDGSRLGELEVRQDGWRIRLRRAPIEKDGAEVATAASRRSDRKPERQAADRPADGQTDGRPQQLRPPDRMAPLLSPAVGYYVARDGLAIGSNVRAGDVLGHVDVLGVRQEVVAPADGLLAAIDAESGEAVEYGQPLGRLERVERRS